MRRLIDNPNTVQNSSATTAAAAALRVDGIAR
jgi:hypothetical protein